MNFPTTFRSPNLKTQCDNIILTFKERAEAQQKKKRKQAAALIDVTETNTGAPNIRVVAADTLVQGSTRRPKRCSRCKSSDHTAPRCPIPVDVDQLQEAIHVEDSSSSTELEELIYKLTAWFERIYNGPMH